MTMKDENTDRDRAKGAIPRSATNGFPTSLAAQALETRTQISKYHGKGGHGFAAEDANHLADAIRGRNAEVVGTSNAVNGADRLVNGVRIQSKYFQAASHTVAAAFDPSSGNYRYAGQVLEVPKDQYETCLKLMRSRIAQGRVPGVDNPADADKLVQPGAVTYRQARNIARAGNVDSLVFDSKTQAVTSTYAAAVSFVVTYAQSRWQGNSAEDSMRAAVGAALSTGGTTLLTGVASAQLLRARAAAMGVVTVRGGVRLISGTSAGRAAVHRIAAGSLGKPVYGAAAVNHVSKLLRTNIVTASIATVVITTPDFYRAAFDRSISWRQFAKNASVNVTGVATGTAGWLVGAGVGAAIGSAVPVVGTAAGGVVGGIVGALGAGVGGSVAAKRVADRVADDDAKILLDIVRDEVGVLAFEYMLTESEVERIASEVNRTATPKWIRRVFKETRRDSSTYRLRRLVRREFEPLYEGIIRSRPRVVLPTVTEVEAEAFALLEQATATVAENGAAPLDSPVSSNA